MSFQSDFSSHAKVGRGKARQIEIWLDIEPPASFADRSIVRWRRAWREGGTTYAWQDFHRLSDNKPIGAKSKVLPWLGRIKYRYVPAIKGQDYFSALLKDVHDCLAETVDRELRAASTSFIDTIRSHTDQISQLTQSSLGIQSRLQLPTDLRALFEVLDFETSYHSEGKSLKQRGDGIKVRHVSAILKFLADQDKKLAGPGRPRSTTIWGYEEPENNLEMSKAFEHAAEIYDFSDEIQILLATHSPAFYSLLYREGRVGGYHVIPSSTGTTLSVLNSNGVGAIDESLGLMTLVAPFIKQKAEEIRAVTARAESLASQLEQVNKLVILVSGITDANYIRAALDVLDSDKAKKVVISFSGTNETGGASGGGDSNLIRFAKELASKPMLPNNKVLVIFDCDVSRVPDDNGKVFYRKLSFRAENTVFKRGIENLLPEGLSVGEFYSSKETIGHYGERSIKQTLDKVRLCNAVCDEKSEIGVEYKARFSNFSEISGWVDEVLDVQ